ncbi:TNF receptor-associated factor 4 [Cimex lectularius]|uniref:MATH domain-containing protein n=1 Tax=Cimex lectularius TaxID=79782 RepID=A0A8I6TJN8_CIMLE|nr:TNF receptor-associated factor 4 [Cimex lectularius]
MDLMECNDAHLCDDVRYQLIHISKLLDQQKQVAKEFILECKKATDKLSNEIKFMKKKFKEMAKLLEELAETVELNSSNAKFSNSGSNNVSVTGVQIPINTNGHLIWVIDNFQTKMESAVEEQNVLCSPSFLTSEFGYKFEVVAYLNGTGQWTDRCMLFSIEHCPTPWDVILPWPCRVKIIFTLIDQSRDRTKAKDVTKLFKNVIINEKKKAFRTFLSKEILKEKQYLNNGSILIVLSVKEIHADGEK